MCFVNKMLLLLLFWPNTLLALHLHLQAVMVGDDIVGDVGGAQACSIRGVQVRTGKYRYS